MKDDLFAAINKPNVHAKARQSKTPSGFNFTGLMCLLLGLVGGYFAGREHLKYEMREAFSSVQSEFKNLRNLTPPSLQGTVDRFRKSP